MRWKGKACLGRETFHRSRLCHHLCTGIHNHFGGINIEFKICFNEISSERQGALTVLSDAPSCKFFCRALNEFWTRFSCDHQSYIVGIFRSYKVAAVRRHDTSYKVSRLSSSAKRGGRYISDGKAWIWMNWWYFPREPSWDDHYSRVKTEDQAS